MMSVLSEGSQLLLAGLIRKQKDLLRLIGTKTPTESQKICLSRIISEIAEYAQTDKRRG
jgi:hypothetical protein